MKVFLDANILFSATNPQWLTCHLLDVLEIRGIQMVSSPYVWEEAVRNVRRHFPKHLGELRRLQARVGIVDESISREGQFEFLPEKDRPVLAAAIHNQCTHLLTGDYKHFGELMGEVINGVKVVSQRMLAEEITAR